MAATKVGSQLSNRYITTSARKFAAHSSRVIAQRPSPNRASARATRPASLAAGRVSRSTQAISGLISRGRTPPTMNRARQSRAPPIDPASRETAAPPRGMPQNMALVTAARRPGGATSAAMAIRLGITPPKPTPAASRKAVNASKVWETAVATEKAPKIRTEASSTGLRPQRSAAQPPATAPITRPSAEALPAQPTAAGPRRNALARCGAATPNAWMS